MAQSVIAAPWLRAAREQLLASVQQDRLAHALLIQDAPGAGGTQLAVWLAQQLFAVTEVERHPDFTRIGFLEESKQIRVEQVRELAAHLALASHQGGFKVALIIAAALCLATGVVSFVLPGRAPTPPGARSAGEEEDLGVLVRNKDGLGGAGPAAGGKPLPPGPQEDQP